MRKIFLLPLLLLAACSGKPSDNNGKADSSAAETPVVKPDTLSDWHSLTESWTQSLNLKNAPIMKSFYADTVSYYGDKISSDAVVKRQQEYFSQNPDYHLRIGEYLGEEQQPDGSWRVRITKTVTAGGKTADYPASLTFARKNGIWKIVAESDDITDINKASTVDAKYAPDVTTVEGIMEETTGFNTSLKGSDPKSDGKENYYIIWPSHPLNLSAGNGNDIAEINVSRLQIDGDAKMITPLLNKKVKITGTLYHGNSPHHFTRVLIKVNTIQEVK